MRTFLLFMMLGLIFASTSAEWPSLKQTSNLETSLAKLNLSPARMNKLFRIYWIIMQDKRSISSTNCVKVSIQVKIYATNLMLAFRTRLNAKS